MYFRIGVFTNPPQKNKKTFKVQRNCATLSRKELKAVLLSNSAKYFWTPFKLEYNEEMNLLCILY